MRRRARNDIGTLFEYASPEPRQASPNSCPSGRLLFTCGAREGSSKAGKVQDALAVVAEALAVAQKNGDHFYDAELYRLKGDLLLAQSAATATEAEACFHQAIEISHRQAAKALELRAVMRLAHLWHKQGKTSSAREKLSENYGWFTEGLDTPDLKEAKAVLQQIS